MVNSNAYITQTLLKVFDGTGLNKVVLNIVQNDLDFFTQNLFVSTDYLKKIENVTFSEDNIITLADVIFQIKDYKFYLTYFINLFLRTKKFDEICVFLNRTFVSHIGNVIYNSEGAFSYSEKYFDRFVECIMYCDLLPSNYLPFLFYILSSNSYIASVYKQPCKLYLNKFISENSVLYTNFIENQNYFIDGYRNYILCDEKMGLTKLINRYLSADVYDSQSVIKLMADYSDVSIEILIQKFQFATAKQQQTIIELFPKLVVNEKNKNQIQNFANTLQDEFVRTKILEDIDDKNKEILETEADFIKLVNDEYIERIDVSLYANFTLYFKSGKRADDNVIAYIFEEFKKATSPTRVKKLEYLKRFFMESSLENFAIDVYNYYVKDVNPSVFFAIKIIFMFMDETKLYEFSNLICDGQLNPQRQNLIACLSAIKPSMFKEKIMSNYLQTQEEGYLNILKNIAKELGEDYEDYMDRLTPTFNFDNNYSIETILDGEPVKILITDTLCVKVLSQETGREISVKHDSYNLELIELIKKINITLRQKIESFKDAFLTHRLWTTNNFESYIMHNPVLRKIASTLVFGEYEFGVLKGVIDIFRYDYSLASPDTKIGLVHLVELDAASLSRLSVIKYEPFKQIKMNVFVPSSVDINNTCCTTFDGVVSVFDLFNNGLKKQGYRVRKDGNRLIYTKEYACVNLFVEIETARLDDKINGFIVLDKVYFYNNLELGNNKDVPDRSKALLIGFVDKRTYSNVMDEINSYIN